MNTNYIIPQLAFTRMNYYNIMSRLTSQTMTKVIALCIFILISMSIDAQTRLIGERSVYTQYYNSPFLLNPGATGQRDFGEVVTYYRNAWTSFPGSPKTVTIGYDGAIGNRIGIGLVGVTDSFAALRTTKGALNLSYTIETPDVKVGLGWSAEYIEHGLDGGDILNNPFVDGLDPEIVAGLEGAGFFDASIGVYGTYQDRITFGLALPSLVSSQVSGPEGDQADGGIGFIANLGYRLDVPEKDIVFEPSIWARQLMLVPFHVDVNLKADLLDEQLSTALTYSVGAEERIGFMIGTQIQNFGFNYSYNFSFHEFQQFNNGSHELGLRLRLQPYTRRAESAQ